MIIDSSAWIDFFRDSDTPATRAVARVIGDGGRLMTTDLIRLELLTGSYVLSNRRRINAALAACEDVGQVHRLDVDSAVGLFQSCRVRGETVRTPNDCLIAAIAIRVGVPVLHNDRDFDVIARHTELVATRG